MQSLYFMFLRLANNTDSLNAATMKAVVLLTFFLSSSLGDFYKGFHFHPHRKTDFQIPLEDMEKHMDDENSDWKFKFKDYGNCVRAKINPFKMPKKLTFCWRHNQEFKDAFNFINLVGTKNGESVVEQFETSSWREMRGNYKMLNYMMIHRNFYGSLWHMVHDVNSESNGMGPQQGQGYTWYEWEHWCVAINFEIGQAISYVNGIKDGDTIQGDHVWGSPLEKAINMSHGGEGIVTDVLFGCNFWNIRGGHKTSFRSMGKITDMHLREICSIQTLIH